MRKKSGFTIVEQAIVLVPEFEMVVHKLEQQVTLRGQSRSTLQNYIRRIALFVIHFGKLPEKIDPEEINEYLAALARDPRSPSRSSFKHMVYGLRYYYRLLGMNREAIALPSLKKRFKAARDTEPARTQRVVCCPYTAQTTDRTHIDLFGRIERTGGN